MQEIWKNIKGYGGLYQVSNTGRIISLKNNKRREIKSFDNNYGYLSVILCVNKKMKSKKVHRLVAETLFELTQHTAMQEFINEDYIPKSKAEELREIDNIDLLQFKIKQLLQEGDK